MDNQQLIEILRSGKNQLALKELYKAFPSIRYFITTHGGNEDEARDVFQESLFVLYRNAQKPDFKLTASVNTYLYSICRFMWKDELVKKNRRVSFEIKDIPEDDINDFYAIEKQTNWLSEVINSLGQKCIQILQLYYYQKNSMEQIASFLGYKNTNTVKTQKYKCIERAKQIAKEQSINSINDIV